MDFKKTVLLTLPLYLMASCSSITEPGLDSKNIEESSKPANKESSSHVNNASGKWVTAYLASYKHLTPEGDNKGNLPTDEIDWSAFTHLNYFALLANPDGSVTDIKPYNNLNPAGIQAITEAGHKVGVPVLITVGGWGNYYSFSNAIKPDSRSKFVDNIMSVFSKWGFDGIDVNMEPIKSSDRENYVAFVNELYNRLQNKSTPLLSRPLLTAAVHWQPEVIAQVQDKFDQINIMTYNLSGAWTGWVTWHNAPVYDGGYIFPGYDHTVPSADKDLDEYMTAGIPAEKLGIGIDFYGYVWTGVSRPKEQWEDGNAPDVEAEVPYHRIMNEYYQPNYYKWDSVAEAAYLSIEDQAQKQFISYDDEHSIRSKYDFVKENNLGGVIIWDLGGGYRQYQPAGQRDNLLQQVKQSFMKGQSQPAPSNDTPPSVSITSPSDGSTVSGTVTINADASDDKSVQQVQFIIDGATAGAPVTSPPYRYSWNTTETSDGAHTVEARATDDAGNQSTTSIEVTVSNNNSKSIYTDALQTVWINSSWSSNTDLSNSEQVFEGQRSIKVDQRSWGALALHSGKWGESEDVSTGRYQTLQLAVYGGNGELDMSISLQNDHGSSFPKVNYGSVPSNQWKTISIPVQELNPENQIVHRLVIQDVSGSSKTFYVDKILFK